MSHDITRQSVLFSTGFCKPLVASFDQPISSSDAGAVLLKPLDDRLGLTRALAAAVTDERDPGRVRHPLLDMIKQRVFGIACGYEDANDAGRLRDDPIQKLLLARDPVSGGPLASQPTLSRFENSVSSRGLYRMGVALSERVIARHQQRLGKRAKRITIDLDATEDAAYGEQQGVLFNGFHGGFCYLPLLGFLRFNDEREQYLFTALLRPGNAGGKLGAISLLKRLIVRLKEAFPHAELLVRCDGGFAGPEVFDFLDARGVGYVIATAKNAVLERLAAPALRAARRASIASGQSERRYGHADYQAQSWPRPRRVVFKAEVTRYPGRDARDNPRFLITNQPTHAKVLYQRVYAQRGDVENRIKELKMGISLDRTSCQRFLANQARVLLHAAAFMLYQELRLLAARTSLAAAQVGTLRERLFKLGGWLKRTARRIVIHLPQDAPWRHEWSTIATNLTNTT